MKIKFEKPKTTNLLDFIEIDGKVFDYMDEDIDVKLERLKTYPEGCFLLKDGEKNIGIITSELWDKFHKPKIGSRAIDYHNTKGKILYLTSFGLIESYRNKKIGEKMVDKLKDHLKQNSLKYIYLRTSKARNFYEKTGFKYISSANDEHGHYDVMKFELSGGKK